MVPLSEIFDVWYGVNLEVVNSEVVPIGIPFVSRQSVNNGIVCHVKRMDDVEPNPSHTLSIAVSGSVLSTFYHDYEYYSGRDIYIAKPKVDLTKEEMLYYCYVIEQNKYRYNYGRGANKTFRSILVPSKDEIPGFVKKKEAKIPFCNKPLISKKIELSTNQWQWFRYDEIFKITTYREGNNLLNSEKGNIPYVGASCFNNGVTNYIRTENFLKGNKITVARNGSVCSAFYQPSAFIVSPDDIRIFELKNFKLNKYIAFFLCCLIEKEKYRYAYGRKFGSRRMSAQKIKLPVMKNTPNKYEPDWQFMEDYIKSLPYSSCL